MRREFKRAMAWLDDEAILHGAQHPGVHFGEAVFTERQPDVSPADSPPTVPFDPQVVHPLAERPTDEQVAQ